MAHRIVLGCEADDVACDFSDSARDFPLPGYGDSTNMWKNPRIVVQTAHDLVLENLALRQQLGS
jgi:hypothetical protein